MGARQSSDNSTAPASNEANVPAGGQPVTGPAAARRLRQLVREVNGLPGDGRLSALFARLQQAWPQFPSFAVYHLAADGLRRPMGAHGRTAAASLGERSPAGAESNDRNAEAAGIEIYGTQERPGESVGWIVPGAAAPLDANAGVLLEQLAIHLGSWLDSAKVPPAAGAASPNGGKRSRARIKSAPGDRLPVDAPVLVWMTDGGGRCVYLSSRWGELTGLDPSASLDTWMDAVHPADQEHVRAARQAAQAEQGSFRIEYRLRRANGQYARMLDTGRPRQVGDPAGAGLIGAAIDLSDPQGPEGSAEAQAERLQLALAASNSGDWSWDAATDVVTLSPRAADIFGVAPGPLMRWSDLRTLLHPTDAERARRAMEVALISRCDYDSEYRIQRAQGVTWAAVRGRGLYDEEGNVAGMIGVLQEINGRKRAENALLDREQRLQQLLSLMPAGTYACDAKGRITFYNKRAVDFWGREPSLNDDRELFCGSHRVLRPDGTELPREEVPMVRVLREGHSIRNLEAPIERPDGSRFVASVNIDPIRDESGQVVGAINVFIDVTERKRAEQLIAGQHRALNLLATHAPLADVLGELARTVDHGLSRSGTAILLRDAAAPRLRLAAAAQLPATFGQALADLPLADAADVVTAALRDNELRIAADLAQLVDWRAHLEILSGAGFHAAWAIPIRAADGGGVGVFLVFLGERRGPTLGERSVLETLARAAAIAIERRHTEAAVQRAEAQLRLVTDSAPVMLIHCDSAGLIQFANRACLERYGRAAAEVIGAPLVELIGPVLLERMRQRIGLVLAGIRVDGEDEAEFPRIGIRTLSVALVPDRTEDGHVRGWVAAMSDITENKRADVATRQLAAIVESSEDAIVSKDLDGNVVSWNRGAERLFGYTAAEMLGQPINGLLPLNRQEEETEILAAVRRGEPVAHRESRRVRKDGTPVDVALTISPIRDAEGRVVGVSAIGRDITRQKQQEAELRRREQLYRAIGESINYGIWVCDATGRNTYASESFLRLVGLTQEECSGEGWKRVLHPDEQDATFAAWAECVRQGQVWEREHTFRGLDGRWHPLLARGVPIRDEAGQITCWAGINLDISAFKQAQDAIRQSESRFRMMADNIAQSAWMADAGGTIFWYNQRWFDDTGTTPAEMNRDGWHQVYPPEQAEQIVATIRHHFAAGQTWEETFPLRSRAGGYRWFLTRAVPIRADSGEIVRWFGTHTDITELRRAQEALHERTQTLETLNRLGNALVAELNLSRIVQMVAAAGREICQADRGLFIPHASAPQSMGGRLEELGLSERDPAVRAVFAGAGSLRIDDYDEAVPERAPHPVRSVLGGAVVSRSGDVLGALFFGRETSHAFSPATEQMVSALAAQAAIAIDNANLYEALQRELGHQKLADAALRAREHELRLVTDHAPVGLILFDRELRLRFANRPFADRWGRDPAAMVGEALGDVVGLATLELLRSHVERALAGEPVRGEVEIAANEGESSWMEVAHVPERGADGRVVGVLAVMNDITARKRAEQEVEIARDRALAASRAKDDFLAALSHELRTPLNPVLLLASEAADDEALDPAVRAAFTTIRNNVELEARLIDDLLDLTRIARGKLPLDLRLQDAHAILEAALNTIRSEITHKGVLLRLELAATCTEVWGDAVRLQQICWNLLKNAVKFTPAGGTINVGTSNDAAGRHLCIQVSDTGIGLTAEELTRVFDAFSQGDHAGGGGSHQFGGIGLGLTISRMLVAQHEGSIRAESPGRNHGATFTIELPLAAHRLRVFPSERAPTVSAMTSLSNPEPPPAVPAAPAGEPPHVLLVEDHDVTRATLTQLLLRRGYRVSGAGNLAEARQLVAETRFSILISDLGLPDGSGYDLMAEVLARHPIQGIALSGYGMEEDVARSRQAGFKYHLTKPIRMQSLDEALAAVAGSRAPFL